MNSVYEVISNRIIIALEKGVIPWRRPWVGGNPMNLVTRKEYRGINRILLGMSPFSSPYWATFNQVRHLGGSVKKGEKGCPVVFWKILDGTPETEETGEDDAAETSHGVRRVPLLRYYTAFNTDQCDGLEVPGLDTKENPGMEEIDAMVAATGCTIVNGIKAFYLPSTDTVTMPERSRFVNSERYYATLFHEMAHWTGHSSRLAREGVMTSGFGSETYGKEELVAEMGAAFLCGQTGIDNTLEESAAYISSWLTALRNQTKWVVVAAAQAQKAADFILSFSEEEEEYQPTAA